MGKEAMISVLFLVWITAASGKKLLTLPNLMEADSTTKACLILQDVPKDDGWENNMKPEDGMYEIVIHINYTAVNSIEEMVIFQDTMDYHNCFDINTPVEPGNSQVIASVDAAFVDDENTRHEKRLLSYEDTIETRVTPLITLIQTDKPIYKPGQTVKFRVMTMNYKMIPQIETYSLITIETPSGTRVKQWRNVVTVSGLVSLEMPLSSDPVLGGWKIKATYAGKDTEQVFTVDEYVLPKFEVTVNSPSYLMPSTRQISGTVCAKYTYGKPVKGDLKMQVCYKSRYNWIDRDTRPCSYITAKIDGCYEYFIYGDALQLWNASFNSYGDLSIIANVTEEQTGIMLTGTSLGPSMTLAPLTMKIEDDSDSQFKPGFPYKARVIVTNPDGTPAPGESLVVTATAYGSGYSWNNTYSTNDDGIAYFSIDDLVKGLGDVNIKVITEVYGDDWRYISGDGNHTTFPPNAFQRIIEWYSASDNFIYIPDVDEAAECDSTVSLDVYFTAERGNNYNFLSIIRAGDSVVDSDKKEIKASDIAFILDIPADDKYEPLTRTEIEVPTMPDYPYIPRPRPHPPLPPLPASPELYSPEGPESMPVEEEIIEPVHVEPLGNKKKK